MSWLSRIQNQPLEIVTGDGSVFYPIWKTAGRSRELNATKFEFDEVEGSLVVRGKVSSAVLPFEIWFQGEDNIEQAAAFDEASKDRRPWTLKHPYYDELLVQPSSLAFNDANQNVTIVTGEFWETIPDTFPDSGTDLKEDVLQSVEQLSEEVSRNYSDALKQPEAGSISTATSVMDTISDTLRAAAVTSEDLEVVEAAIAEAYSALNKISSDANTFMVSTATLARVPARFYADINTRVAVIQANYNDLKLAVNGLLTRQNKLYFESFGASLIGSLAETSVLTASDIADEQGIDSNSIFDYVTRTSVVGVIDTINILVNDFLSTLGGYQTIDSSTPSSFVPNPDTIIGVNETALKAISNLNEIAIGAKQQRAYVLPEDMALIPLIHRIYGVIENQTVNAFIQDNKIGLSEMLILKKDREVIYYV